MQLQDVEAFLSELAQSDSDGDLSQVLYDVPLNVALNKTPPEGWDREWPGAGLPKLIIASPAECLSRADSLARSLKGRVIDSDSFCAYLEALAYWSSALRRTGAPARGARALSHAITLAGRHGESWSLGMLLLRAVAFYVHADRLVDARRLTDRISSIFLASGAYGARYLAATAHKSAVLTLNEAGRWGMDRQKWEEVYGYTELAEALSADYELLRTSVLHEKASACIGLGRLEEASEIAEILVGSEDEAIRSRGYYTRGSVFWVQGEFHSAIADYEKGIRTGISATPPLALGELVLMATSLYLDAKLPDGAADLLSRYRWLSDLLPEDQRSCFAPLFDRVPTAELVETAELALDSVLPKALRRVASRPDELGMSARLEAA
jgi:tetratricopeptide (TPR) repeat protein